MTHEHDLDTQLREWLREVPPVHPNLEVSILEETRDIPQRRRSWWPFGWPGLGPVIDSGRFSWTGAAKFIVAGLVVGLFGGFLLMSVVVSEPGEDVAPAGPTTTPSVTAAEATATPQASSTVEPVARTTIPPSVALDAFEATLSAASTRSVAPGVTRLLDDGAQHQFISWRDTYEDAADGALKPLSGASVAPDGSIWIAGYGATGAPRVTRFGGQGQAALDTELGRDASSWLSAGPDDIVWAGSEAGLFRFDGSRWRQPEQEDMHGIHSVAIMPDGSAWVAWTVENGDPADSLSYYREGEWRHHASDIAELLESPPGGLAFRSVTAAPDGELLAIAEVRDGREGALLRTELLRHDGSAWRALPQERAPARARLLELAAAPDGDLWGYYQQAASGEATSDAEAPGEALLVRLDGEETSIGSTDGLPNLLDVDEYGFRPARLRVGPDGTIWMVTERQTLTSFDGRAWAEYPAPGTRRFDIGPDGSAIVVDHDGVVYRIVPSPGTTAAIEPDLAPQSAASDGTPTGDLIARLATEEVEPGVQRILRDGSRDLTFPASSQQRGNLYGHPIVAGQDGSVWILGPDDYYRLGDDRTFSWRDAGPTYGDPDLIEDGANTQSESPHEPSAWDGIVVGTDGRMWYPIRFPPPWVNDGEPPVHSLWSFDGEAWSATGPEGVVFSVAATADGSVWAAWQSGSDWQPEQVQVRRIVGDDWIDVGGPVDVSASKDGKLGLGLRVADSGEVWLAAGDLYRYDGETWQLAPDPPEVADHGNFDLSSDGTAWISAPVSYGNAGSDQLFRFDGETWTTTTEDHMPERGTGRWEIPHRAAPDGSVWFALKGQLECGGVGNFDGTTWRTYLPGTCVYAMDVAPDGSLWFHGSPIRWNKLGDDLLHVRPTETYVIRPSVVADAD